MTFRRVIGPPSLPDSAALTRAMVGIGMGFAGRGDFDVNIEDTLFFAAQEGMDRDDLRVLSVTTTWFGVHAALLNAGRLTYLVSATESPRVRAFFCACARWHASDRRFARLGKMHRGERIDVLPSGTEFQIRRHGEDPRFRGGPLRVPANLLRDRAADVLAAPALAAKHRAYRWRLIIGPSYRADMWAALEGDPTLSSAALARATYGSFATAWAVKRDFATANLAHPARALG